MSQAIHTKLLSPTGSRGTRIQAKSESGQSITRAYDYSLESEENHAMVAGDLLRKLRWRGKWFFGSTKEGYVFVKDDGVFLSV